MKYIKKENIALLFSNSDSNLGKAFHDSIKKFCDNNNIVALTCDDIDMINKIKKINIFIALITKIYEYDKKYNELCQLIKFQVDTKEKTLLIPVLINGCEKPDQLKMYSEIVCTSDQESINDVSERINIAISDFQATKTEETIKYKKINTEEENIHEKKTKKTTMMLETIKIIIVIVIIIIATLAYSIMKQHFPDNALELSVIFAIICVALLAYLIAIYGKDVVGEAVKIYNKLASKKTKTSKPSSESPRTKR